MERIVILTDRLGPDNGLTALLNRIFPECDICYVSGNMNEHEANRGGSLSQRPIINCPERRACYGIKF